MAAAESEEGWEVQCAYCFSPDTEMINPRKLPCGHVNCLRGIQDDFEANKIMQCPKCRRAFDMKPMQLDTYCPGQSVASGNNCGVCLDVKEPAKVYCPTCPKKMCKVHEKEHEHWFPEHTEVMSMMDYVRQSRRLTPICCLKHKDQQLVLICEDCSTKFCWKCQDTNDVCNKGGQVKGHHKLISISKLSGDLMDDLKEVKSLAMVKESTYKDFAKECAQIICDFDTKTINAVSLIHKTKKEQLDALSREYDALEKRYCEQREGTRKSISQFANVHIEGKQKEILNQIHLLDTAIQDMHEIEVIECHSKRKLTVEKLVTEPMPFMIFDGPAKVKMTGKHRSIDVDLDYHDAFTVGDATKAEMTLDKGHEEAELDGIADPPPPPQDPHYTYRPSRTNERYPDNQQVFVGNLPKNVSDLGLKRFFTSQQAIRPQKTTFQRSAKGPLAISQVDQAGNWIEVENTGRKMESIGGWKVGRKVDGKSMPNFTFPENMTLGNTRENRSVKVYAKYKGPTGALEYECDNWGTGSQVTTSLISPAGEDKATHIQKATYAQ